MNGLVQAAPPFSNEEAAKRVRAALVDAGADVIHTGTVEWNGTFWALCRWDVQNITREQAVSVARGALSAAVDGGLVTGARPVPNERALLNQ